MLLNCIVIGAILFALLAAFGGFLLAKLNARRRRNAKSMRDNLYPGW